MTKTTRIIAIIGAFTLGGAATVRAQAPDSRAFVNISGGGQLQTHAFTEAKTFSLFGETGIVTSTQTVGKGYVFDATFGYRIWRPVAVAIGMSTFRGSGSGSATAAIPSSLFTGVPTITRFEASDYGDLAQTGIAVNFQVMILAPVSERWDLAVFGGPSVIRVSQQIASATPTLNPTATVDKQSKTTARAGTAGADLTYRMNERYGLGGFVRYLGGEVDLPTVPDLQVGGLQIGGGIRIDF